METLYLVKNRNFWGDYGDILVSGFILDKDEQGRALLGRTGPFVPPISFPWGCVVTDELRNELDQAGFRGLKYREVIKAKVVRLEWQYWDRNADLEDDQLPACEPEDYILRGRNSPRLAREMTNLWQITPEARIRCVRTTDRSPRRWDHLNLALIRDDWPGDVFDVFQLGLSDSVLVNERVREFLAARCGEWCEFEQVPVAPA